LVKSKEVSNKTLLILIVAVTVVTIVSTWFIVDSVFKTQVMDVQAESGAEVSLVILEDGAEQTAEVEDEGQGAEVSLVVEEQE
jgi:flagellar basal body-associated protein FliL